MSNRILIVDDEPDVEPLVTQRLRKAIRDGRYDFTFARSGREALDQLATHDDIALVVSDINMPEMDGLTLIGRIADDHPAVKTLVVSAYGDMANIRAAMNRGAFDFVTKPIDFVDLERTMDRTLAAIAQWREAEARRLAAEAARASLARYFPPNVVDLLVASSGQFDEARSQRAAILFADIVGFTRYCARHTEQQVFTALRTFLAMAAGAVLEHGGTLEKFLGDGLMATFGTPTPGPRDSLNALACVAALRAGADDLNRARIAAGDEPLRLSVGLHIGDVMIGNVGDARRLELATIGDPVNIASRVEALSRLLEATSVVTEDAVQAALAEDEAEARTLLRPYRLAPGQTVRGREGPLDVWIC